jgi:hypothetical protein
MKGIEAISLWRVLAIQRCIRYYTHRKTTGPSFPNHKKIRYRWGLNDRITLLVFIALSAVPWYFWRRRSFWK